MRVALVGTGVHAIPPTGYGGVERTIAELAEALRAAGAEVTVLNEVRRERSTDEYRFAAGLARRVVRLDADVVHAATPVVANALSIAGPGYVYTSHSRHWFEARGLRQRWGAFLERRAVRRASATIALTDAMYRRMADRVPSARASMRIIPIGVDVAHFRPAWPERTGRRAIGVGVVRPFKRWELAAAALRGTGWSLRVVGPIPDPEYAAQVRAAGDGVELTGEVPEEELRHAMAESDMMVHPSRVEILAGAVLQGFASGLPVLGAAPVADLIEPGAGAAAPEGATDPELVEFLRAGAVRWREDPPALAAAGRTARAAAERRFSWGRVAEAHLDVYRSVAGH